MSESTKYDLFMKEIESLESVIQSHVSETEIVINEKNALKQKVDSLTKRKRRSIVKIKELEKKLTLLKINLQR